MEELQVMGSAVASAQKEDPNEPMVQLSPMQVMTLRQAIQGANMHGYTEMLKMLEIVLPTERQFERARAQTLRLANDQGALLTRIIQDTIFPGESAGRWSRQRRGNAQGADSKRD